MARASPPDSVPLPGVLLRRFAAFGFDVADVLHRAKIVRPKSESRWRITNQQFFDLWRVAEDSAGSREMGLRLGADAPPQYFAIGSLAALHSRNAGEALAKFARYKRLVAPQDILLDFVEGEARLSLHWLLAFDPAPPILVDAMFATALAIVRRGTGKPLLPRRVELARRRTNEEMLTRHFGCDVCFDAPVDMLVFDAAALQERFITHDAALLACVVPDLEAALEQQSGRRTLAGDVRMTLLRSMRGERPSIAKIAEQMRVSARTLQRRLEQADTSYQDLLDDVRRRSARRLLASTDLGTTEIAFLLGFEELNSFTRAFRGWEGTTPMRWRDEEGR